jgi:hypothetical protein
MTPLSALLGQPRDMLKDGDGVRHNRLQRLMTPTT